MSQHSLLPQILSSIFTVLQLFEIECSYEYTGFLIKQAGRNKVVSSIAKEIFSKRDSIRSRLSLFAGSSLSTVPQHY